LTGRRVINRDMSVGRELSSMNAVASTQGHLAASKRRMIGSNLMSHDADLEKGERPVYGFSSQ
jgi:hypothetical protein